MAKLNIPLPAFTITLVLVLAANCATVLAAGPYCGVYCAYAAMKLQGSPVALNDLLDQKYISSGHGSTVDDLCRAIRENGGRAAPLTGLGAASLCANSDPIILHVRRPGYHAEFAHWVLCLGCDGSSVRVLDPPGDARDIPMAELLAVWDGVGIVVEGRPNSSRIVQACSWLVQAAELVGVTILIVTLRRVFHRQQHRPAMAVGTVTIAVVLVAATFHLAWESGFLRAPSAVGEVSRKHFDCELPIVKAEDVANLAGRAHVTLIDCRLEGDFARGHVPGAINLPIHANTSERVKTLDTIPRGNRLIVYCMSEKCEWAKQIGGDLFHRGYSDVSVFHEGWNGWCRYQQDAISVRH
jgi:rhodanese-related sulfurtransferase